MSDPVSNHDIEDVLSSIRRLVAQGDPRRPTPVANAPTPLRSEEPAKEEVSAPPAPTDRLVLTPAFRVSVPTEEVQAAQPDPVATDMRSVDAVAQTEESDAPDTQDDQPIPASVQSSSERASLEATIAQLEAAVSRRTDEWEPDGSEVAGLAGLHAAFASRQSEAPTTVEEETKDAEATLNAVVADHISDVVAEEIAVAFPPLADADAAQEIEDTVVHLKPDLHIAKETPAPVTLSVVTPDPVQDDEAISDTDTPAPEVAEVEVVEPPIPFADPSVLDAPTFRHAFREVYDPVAEATADAAEAAPDAADLYGDELTPDPAEASTAVAEPASANALVDPDMLRDMVGHMIREELQGEMGERITRNVRKLVRREINRVLSAQEFD